MIHEILHPLFPPVLLFFKKVEIHRANAADNVCFSGFKPHQFRILVTYDRRDDSVEVRQPLPVRVYLPVVRIPLENHSLTSDVFSEAKRPQSRYLS